MCTAMRGNKCTVKLLKYTDMSSNVGRVTQSMRYKLTLPDLHLQTGSQHPLQMIHIEGKGDQCQVKTEGIPTAQQILNPPNLEMHVASPESKIFSNSHSVAESANSSDDEYTAEQALPPVGQNNPPVSQEELTALVQSLTSIMSKDGNMDKLLPTLAAGGSTKKKRRRPVLKQPNANVTDMVQRVMKKIPETQWRFVILEGKSYHLHLYEGSNVGFREEVGRLLHLTTFRPLWTEMDQMSVLVSMQSDESIQEKSRVPIRHFYNIFPHLRASADADVLHDVVYGQAIVVPLNQKDWVKFKQLLKHLCKAIGRISGQ